jgi:hypothetical protein
VVVPAGQGWQLLLPTEGLKVPTGQWLQAVPEKTPVWRQPGSQARSRLEAELVTRA